MDKKNYQSKQTKKSKGSAIITGIVIFLVATLALGGVAYSFRSDINGLFNKKPVIDEPVIDEPIIDEPVIDEPIIDEPIIDEPIIDEPIIDEPIIDEPVVGVLVEGSTVGQLYFNVNNFEDLIKSNIDNLQQNTDQAFGSIIVDLFLPVFDIEKESGAVTNFEYKFSIGITTFSEVFQLLDMPLPDGVSDTDFCLFVTSENYVDFNYYSSANLSIDTGESILSFTKGFNDTFISANAFGLFIETAVLDHVNSNPDMSNRYQKQSDAVFTVDAIYNQEVCDLILKDRPFPVE